MMSRKDYVIIAEAVREVYREYADDNHHEEECHGIEAVVANLSHHLAMDNPRFDRERFHKAALKVEE